MRATDFTRDDCKVGNRRRAYETLRREWVCNVCGGRLVVRWTDHGWMIACGVCSGQDFIHEEQLRREKADAVEVVDGLPEHLREQLEPEPEIDIQRGMELLRG